MDSPSRIFKAIIGIFILLLNVAALYWLYIVTVLDEMDWTMLLVCLLTFIVGIVFGFKHKWIAALVLTMFPTVIALLLLVLF